MFFFQGKVFAVENNQLEMDQESSDYLEKIEAFSDKGAEFIVNYAQSKKVNEKLDQLIIKRVLIEQKLGTMLRSQ